MVTLTLSLITKMARGSAITDAQKWRRRAADAQKCKPGLSQQESKLTELRISTTSLLRRYEYYSLRSCCSLSYPKRNKRQRWPC